MFLSLAPTLPASIQAELGLLRGSLDDVHWMQAEQCLIPLQNLGQITSRHQMEELDMALSHFRSPSIRSPIRWAKRKTA